MVDASTVGESPVHDGGGSQVGLTEWYSYKSSVPEEDAAVVALSYLLHNHGPIRFPVLDDERYRWPQERIGVLEHQFHILDSQASQATAQRLGLASFFAANRTQTGLVAIFDPATGKILSQQRNNADLGAYTAVLNKALAQ